MIELDRLMHVNERPKRGGELEGDLEALYTRYESTLLLSDVRKYHAPMQSKVSPIPNIFDLL
jgi:hypothetical protein